MDHEKDKARQSSDQGCHLSRSCRRLHFAAGSEGPPVPAEQTRDALQQQVDEQAQYNAELQDDIDNSDDPDVILEVAKERLGLVGKDEVIFYDTTD